MLSDSAVLHRLLCGSVRAGSILQLDHFHQLPYLLQVSLGRWLSTVARAVLEEIQHSPKTLQSDSPGPKSSPCPTIVTSSSVQPTSPTFTRKQDSRAFSSQPSSQQQLLSDQSFSSNTPEYSSTMPQYSNTTTNEGPATSKSSSRETTREASRETATMDWYQCSGAAKMDSRVFGYGGGAPSRYVEMDGNLLKVSPAFSCVLVGDASTQPIPEQLKVRMLDTHTPTLGTHAT